MNSRVLVKTMKEACSYIFTLLIQFFLWKKKSNVSGFWVFPFQPLGRGARYPGGISCRHSYRRTEWEGKVQIVGGRGQFESCHGHSWGQRNQNNIEQHLRGNTTREGINWWNTC